MIDTYKAAVVHADLVAPRFTVREGEGALEHLTDLLRPTAI